MKINFKEGTYTLKQLKVIVSSIEEETNIDLPQEYEVEEEDGDVLINQVGDTLVSRIPGETSNLYDYIRSCNYDLPFVEQWYDSEMAGYREEYHTHFDNGCEHYKFGGEYITNDIIAITWALVWTLGSEDYACNAGEGEGTYVSVHIPTTYVKVEEWEDGGSFPDFPSKLRLATNEEINQIKQ